MVATGDEMPANYDELFGYIKSTKAYNDQVRVNRGNPEQALKQASKTYEATYRWPFQLHGMMGPSCAVADVNGDQVTLYTGTQGSFETREAVAQLLGIPEKNVRVLWREAAGSYGRLGADDAAEDAALLSRAVGKPVRVQWMRDDEHAWDPKGPAQLGLARARRRRPGQSNRLGLRRSWLSAHGRFRPRLASARFAPDRHESHRHGQLQRQSRCR